MSKSRLALITGSAKGIGVQIATLLAKKGYNIVINYRSSKKEALMLANYLKETYQVATLAIQADVSLKEDVGRMFKMIKEKLGDVDILIHNAGPFIREDKTIHDYNYQEWDYLIKGNLNSYFYLLKEVLPGMRKSKWGRIVVLGFNGGSNNAPWKYRGVFAAAKSAVISLTKTLALEERDYGITANVVSPGDIKSEFKELTIKEVENPFKMRNATGEDVGRVIAFLCEEDSDYLSRAVIDVSGGLDILMKKTSSER
ncbi:MAG TPA: SDR family oxidoreductase [Acholeplasmataceae bacterium]|nr:SDR family oxidoreductase [Acholeplasmataceae bacterium]